jgi:hypothetical protein
MDYYYVLRHICVWHDLYACKFTVLKYVSKSGRLLYFRSISRKMWVITAYGAPSQRRFAYLAIFVERP